MKVDCLHQHGARDRQPCDLSIKNESKMVLVQAAKIKFIGAE